MKLKKLFITLVVLSIINLLVFSRLNVGTVYAVSCSTINEDKDFSEGELEDVIEACEKKLDSLQGRVESLSNEIDYLNTQLNLTQSRIQNSIRSIKEKELQIQKLSVDIEDLKVRIEKLKTAVDYQQSILNERFRERYKSFEVSPIVVIFGSDTINSLVQKSEYLRVMEAQDRKIIDQMNATKESYDKQKNLYENTKQQQEELHKQLLAEKANLDSYNNKLGDQKDEKSRLLEITQNDEAKYQKLLNEAKTQLESFSSFVSSAGGGSIDADGFGKGKEGWYMSQRDSRWSGKKIGNSNENIFNVGCLVASVAMIYKANGSNETPATIADQDSRFFSNTAMMLIPWKGPKGKTYTPISVSNIDKELSNGNQVIVGIYYGQFGTHFVVISSKSGSDWIIYDPYYGPDLKFTARYSKNSIFQAVVFK